MTPLKSVAEIVGFLLGTLAYCAELSAKPIVTCSVEPLSLIAREICGDACEVLTLVPRGVSEHGWQPGPKDIVKAKNAVASVAVGLNFDEQWYKKLDVSPKTILWLGASLSPMSWWSDDMMGHASKHHEHHEPKNDAAHAHGPNDPHVWVDAGRMAKAADLMAAHFGQMMPDQAVQFKARGQAIAARLTTLQLDVDRRRKSWRVRPVVMFHDLAGYFARRFDLPVLSVASGGAGHDLSARMIANVARRFKTVSVAAVMVERQDGAAKSLARELKTSVIIVDFSAANSYGKWDDWFLSMVSSWEGVLK